MADTSANSATFFARESRNENISVRPHFPAADNLNAVPANISDVPLGGRVHWTFRAFDLCLALLCIPVAIPLLAVLAVIVKLDDPKSPVLFVHTRYGLNGRPFRMFKIRTMVPDAEKLKLAVLDLSEDKGAGFKIERDPRITRPGRWIRRLYLDEVPQLWNVVRGDMSFVGPRANSYPPDTYEPWERRRLLVKPGMTGTWQVMIDKPSDFAERCRIDIEYIKAKSLGGDLRILLRTMTICLIKQTGC